MLPRTDPQRGPRYLPRAGVAPTSPCLNLSGVEGDVRSPPTHKPSPVPGTGGSVPPARPVSQGDHRPQCPLSSALADVAYLRSVLPSTTEDAFFDYLATLDASEVTVSAVPEGSVVFARVGRARYPPLLWRGCGTVGSHVPGEDGDVTAWLSPAGAVPAGEGAAAGGAADGDRVAVPGQLRQVGTCPALVPLLPGTTSVSTVPSPTVVPATTPCIGCGRAERVLEPPPTLNCVLAPRSARLDVTCPFLPQPGGHERHPLPTPCRSRYEADGDRAPSRSGAGRCPFGLQVLLHWG